VQVEWILWACVAIVALQALATNVVLFVLARVLWGVCLAALLPVFYGLLARAAADGEQGRVLGAGNGAAKAGALLGAGAGGLALAWVPLSAMFWTVALLYAVAAVGMRAIRTRSNTFQHIQTTTGIS
jgi:MFS family permease